MSIRNWGDLKQAIINDVNRDDLTDIIIDHAESIIRRLQRDFFYATPITGYVTLVPSQAIYDSAIQTTAIPPAAADPHDIVKIDFIRLLLQDVWQWMPEVEYERLLHADVNQPPVDSQPTVWAVRDAIFRVYPPPDQPYVLEISGNAKIPVPASDTDSNFWCENAADLVRFSTLAQVYAVRIHDDASYQRCALMAEQHRISLVRESNAKGTVGQIQAYW